MWGRMLARLDDVWVITRANNADAVTAALPGIPERDRLQFEFVDLPRWARFWKRRQRGVRLYYMLWQLAALKRARRLARRQSFDIIWHLTLANVWLGSLAPLVGGRFVYGPVGGGVGLPWGFITTLGLRGFTYELLRAGARTGMRYLNPVARMSWRRAALILVQNRETRDWLPERYRDKVRVLPNAMVESEVPVRARAGGSQGTACFVGRLVPLKGVILAVQSLQLLDGWRLIIAGSGPDRKRAERLANKLQVANRVEFRGWLERAEVLRVMREEADVLLFPSFHDEAGLVVIEAAQSGLPTVCLDRGGPPLLGGKAITAKHRSDAVPALAAAVLAAAHDPRFEVPTIESLTLRIEELLRDRGLMRNGSRAGGGHGSTT
jgi:glycosyltransferase involved in cell wall biosynthesis